MMVTTHALAGLVLAIPVALVAPEFTTVAAAAALAGGVFPDLDMPGAHRRTLHFPVYYSLVASVAVAVAVLFPAAWSVAAALFVAAAALHALTDALGGGLELRPWEATGERAVYSHYHGRWWRPRRWIRYDGAPEDAVATVLLAVPGVLAYEGRVEAAVVGAVLIGVGYAAIRRPLIDWTERVVRALPPELVDRVPGRMLDDFR
ncbi:MAG: metal-dependent hydrolase [Halolamina sp.]